MLAIPLPGAIGAIGSIRLQGQNGGTSCEDHFKSSSQVTGARLLDLNQSWPKISMDITIDVIYIYIYIGYVYIQSIVYA